MGEILTINAEVMGKSEENDGYRLDLQSDELKSQYAIKIYKVNSELAQELTKGNTYEVSIERGGLRQGKEGKFPQDYNWTYLGKGEVSGPPTPAEVNSTVAPTKQVSMSPPMKKTGGWTESYRQSQECVVEERASIERQSGNTVLVRILELATGVVSKETSWKAAATKRKAEGPGSREEYEESVGTLAMALLKIYRNMQDGIPPALIEVAVESETELFDEGGEINDDE